IRVGLRLLAALLRLQPVMLWTGAPVGRSATATGYKAHLQQANRLCPHAGVVIERKHERVKEMHFK
ncbi:MAG: hypothetical protein ACP5DZ_06775, partial [Bacteroidales bacterium]